MHRVDATRLNFLNVFVAFGKRFAAGAIVARYSTTENTLEGGETAHKPVHNIIKSKNVRRWKTHSCILNTKSTDAHRTQFEKCPTMSFECSMRQRKRSSIPYWKYSRKSLTHIRVRNARKTMIRLENVNASICVNR